VREQYPDRGRVGSGHYAVDTSPIGRFIQAEVVREQGAEENIWTEEGSCDGRLEETA
jgi:hypothetical protein